MNNATTIILGIPLLCLLGVLVLLVASASQALIVNTHKSESWPRFAAEIGARFQTASGGQPDRVTGQLGALPFYLDTYITGDKQSLKHYTRLRAFYPPHIPLEFLVISEALRDEVFPSVSLLGVDTSELGLDADLCAYASHPDLLRRILANDQLTRMLNAIKPLDVQIRRRRNWKGGGVSSAVYEVHVQMNGVVTDETKLRDMFGLLEECLRQLQLIGVAGTSFAETLSQTPTS